LAELLSIPNIRTGIKHPIEGRRIWLRVLHKGGVPDFSDPSNNRSEEANCLNWAVIRRSGETADDSAPSLDMGEVIRTKDRFNDGTGVKGMPGFDGGDGEEAERVGIKAVELILMAEAGDDGLGAGEGFWGVLVRELRD